MKVSEPWFLQSLEKAEHSEKLGKRLASRIQYLMPLHPPISEYLEGSKFHLCLWNVGLRGVLMSSAENSFMELGP